MVLEPVEGRDDAVEALPVARGATDAAIDDQVLRVLGHLCVEIVLEHPHRSLGLPAERSARRPAAGGR